MAMAKNETELERIANILDMLKSWLTKNKFEVAPEETQAVMYSGCRIVELVDLRIRGNTIEFKKVAKYLGVKMIEWP